MSVQGLTGAVGAHRSMSTGGAAYGIPFQVNVVPSAEMTPGGGGGGGGGGGERERGEKVCCGGVQQQSVTHRMHTR